jgi:hypothetical protein
MLVMSDMFFFSKEVIEKVISNIKENTYHDKYRDAADIHYDFLMECFDADEKLQKMVFDKIGEDYISFVILPINPTERLDSFSFSLVHVDNKKVKKRDDLIYKDLCKICFGEIKPLFWRLVDFYEKP